MVYTNNIYSWNTSEEDYFTFEVGDFKISIDGISEDFVLDFYYRTDQKKPYFLFDKKEYRHFGY